MKALQIVNPGEITIVDIPLPGLSEGEILLKLEYIGLCGSDLSTYLGKNPMVQYPRIPGHEISAAISEIGNNVPGSFSAGQKVTVVPYTSCGNCSSCKNGKTHACRYNQTLGVQRDGALTEYIAVPWQKVINAERLSYKELALTEPLTVGFHAVDRGKVTDTDTVMVLGCGMIGSGSIISAALRKARVIAVDIDDKKLTLARELGAQFTINSLKDNVHEVLEKITNGHGPSVVIEAAGNPETYLLAINEVAFTGSVVYIGYVKDEVAFQTKFFVQKEINIMGSRNAASKDFEAVIQYLETGKCPVNKLISRVVSMKETAETIRFWSEHPGEIVKILVKL
jgi:2-desacetyl-2-hydroxyethyl bacteriochlorophyllide A dehydrogenase